MGSNSNGSVRGEASARVTLTKQINVYLPNSWSTSTVGNGESFVQVKVANVGAALGRARETNHGVLGIMSAG
jgi:hypothetical protein